MSKKHQILCFGEILWDIFHEETQERRVLGGAPSNLCYFFNALGESAQLISQVGNDVLGAEALQKLRTLQMPHHITQGNLPTGKVDITIEDQEPQYQFNEPAAWDNIPYHEITQEIGKKAEIIAFGSLAQRSELENSSFTTLQKILNSNPQATRFLDLNLRAPHFTEKRVLELLALADILKINEEEFKYLKKLFSIENLSTRDALYQLIIVLKLNFIILTLGADGSIVMSETDYSAKSIQKAEIADTVGAGDSFSAAFLTALNHGASFATAHHFANQFSSYICTQHGAFVPIPHQFKDTLISFSAW